MNAVTGNPALALADCWQREFPLVPAPFDAIGKTVELSGREVMELLQSLMDAGVLARIGAAVRPNTVGASTLAAMAVPEERLREVAALVSRHPAVNHNYEREHDINLWFVVTAANRADVETTLADLERRSGVGVYDLPLEKAYHIDLGFRLSGEAGQRRLGEGVAEKRQVTAKDRALLQALESGLELVDRPYARLGERTGLNEAQVLGRLGSLVATGVVARFGCILRHRRLGYAANAMAVWDVPDDDVDRLGDRLARRTEVTLCYRRVRRPPAWPYNLFAMVHGRARDAVTAQVAAAARETGLQEYPSAILFSRQCFKQSAARMAPNVSGAP